MVFRVETFCRTRGERERKKLVREETSEQDREGKREREKKDEDEETF